MGRGQPQARPEIDRDRAAGPRGVPGIDRPPRAAARAGRRSAASARATPAWVAARSASLRVLRVGVFAAGELAPRSSSAPRAIPRATAAIDAASRPKGGNAYSGPGSRGESVISEAERAAGHARARRPRCRGCRSPRRPETDQVSITSTAAAGHQHQADVRAAALERPRPLAVVDDAAAHQPVAVGDVAGEAPAAADRRACRRPPTARPEGAKTPPATAPGRRRPRPRALGSR